MTFDKSTSLQAVFVGSTAVVAGLLGAYLFLGRRRKEEMKSETSTNANPWSRSISKGQLGYYQAHHIGSGEKLDASVYTMNKPRRLDPKSKKPLDDDVDSSIQKETPVKKVPIKSAGPQFKEITQYAWTDTAKVVTVYIEHEHWREHSTLKIEKLSDTSLRLELALNDGCSYLLLLSPLYAAISKVTSKKSAKRLTLKLTKRDSSLEKWPSLLSRVVGTAMTSPASASSSSTCGGVDEVDEVD